MSADATSHASPAPRLRHGGQSIVTKAAQPTKIFFDPYNSSATGHQTAPSRLAGTTSWRDSRNRKLREQYSGGQSGGQRLYDTVGAGSENFGQDGRKDNGDWEKGASGLRSRGQRSIAEALGAKASKGNVKPKGKSTADENAGHASFTPALPQTSKLESDTSADDTKSTKPQIFTNLCFYINGSTAPLISDHKLKYVLTEHGGRTSVALGRRTVTHVILGTGCERGGAGGGLSSSKIQKEIARVRGKGVKFVTADWVVESVKAGKRLPEVRFTGMKLASKGQGSVYGLFKKEHGERVEAVDKG